MKSADCFVKDQIWFNTERLFFFSFFFFFFFFYFADRQHANIAAFFPVPTTTGRSVFFRGKGDRSRFMSGHRLPLIAITSSDSYHGIMHLAKYT